MRFLVAGLGNIGDEYRNTRHNAGFRILDYIAGKNNLSFAAGRYADIAEMKVKNKHLVLIKPTTYMNLSGKAVSYWLKKMDIPVENLLVLVDDIALPTGKVRLKSKGGDGGHNGLIDIIDRLNTESFSRLRFGIGNSFYPGGQVEYVLGEWNKDEEIIIGEKVEIAMQAVLSWALEGVEIAMTRFNNN